ncbi:MAG: hypothetical protein KIT56_08755, partial [Gammaproteobacteria bacterium]|nr:hypothetical protein [Gammaproteobacteria bacterium]
NPILQLSELQIINGFKSVFNELIQNKIKEFSQKKQNKSFLDFQNYSAIDKKVEFLNKIKQQLDNASSYNDLNALFSNNDPVMSKIDGDTLKLYQDFKNIFSEIYLLNQPELNQNILKNT